MDVPLHEQHLVVQGRGDVHRHLLLHTRLHLHLPRAQPGAQAALQQHPPLRHEHRLPRALRRRLHLPQRNSRGFQRGDHPPALHTRPVVHQRHHQHFLIHPVLDAEEEFLPPVGAGQQHPRNRSILRERPAGHRLPDGNPQVPSGCRQFHRQHQRAD